MSPEQARGQAGRQAHRHLGVRLRALRDADRARRVCGRDGLGHDREDSRARARLVGAARRRRRAPIRRLLLRCLAKDPKQRLRDIGDVRIEIDAIDEVLPGTSRRAGRPPAAAASRTAGCHGSRSSRSPRLSASWEAHASDGRAGRIRWRTPGSRPSRIGTARKAAPRSRPTEGSWRLSPTVMVSSTLAEPGGHRAFQKPHARTSRRSVPRHRPAELRLLGRRRGDLVRHLGNPATQRCSCR